MRETSLSWARLSPPGLVLDSGQCSSWTYCPCNGEALQQMANTLQGAANTLQGAANTSHLQALLQGEVLRQAATLGAAAPARV